MKPVTKKMIADKFWSVPDYQSDGRGALDKDCAGVFDDSGEGIVAIYRDDGDLFFRDNDFVCNFKDVDFSYSKKFTKSYLKIISKQKKELREVRCKINISFFEFIDVIRMDGHSVDRSDYDVCYFAYNIYEKGKIDWVFDGPEYLKIS